MSHTAAGIACPCALRSVRSTGGGVLIAAQPQELTDLEHGVGLEAAHGELLGGLRPGANGSAARVSCTYLTVHLRRLQVPMLPPRQAGAVQHGHSTGAAGSAPQLTKTRAACAAVRMCSLSDPMNWSADPG